MIKRLILAYALLLLSACSNFFDTDNTPTPAPLIPFTAEIKPHLLWSAKTGGSTGNEYLNLTPTLNGDVIYSASANGMVTATNKHNGHTDWRVDTDLPITAAPGAGEGIIVIGSRAGEVLALEQTTGKTRWKKTIPGEILAKPAIGNHIVAVKTIDGTIHALAVRDGHTIWSFQQTEPNLILRGSSAPHIQGNSLFVGFANGNLAKISTLNGQMDWIQPIAVSEGAFSIQRMIDIDANPIIINHRVFAASYQGKIASLDWNSGALLWSRDISSYAGMCADQMAVYASDAKSHVWAFNAKDGSVIWQQGHLAARNVVSPVSMGNYVVVGDAEGYLHWLNKHDGHFAGREFVGNAITTVPIVENNVLYVLTNNGSLVAYTLSP
jgi:outer membrane protein assembly factor BamB